MKATIKITINYDKAHVSSGEDIKRALNFAVQHLANNGLLSDGESIVDAWRHQVKVTPSRIKHAK